eukprot:113355-Rhodomonas_salina.5
MPRHTWPILILAWSTKGCCILFAQFFPQTNTSSHFPGPSGRDTINRVCGPTVPAALPLEKFP